MLQTCFLGLKQKYLCGTTLCSLITPFLLIFCFKPLLLEMEWKQVSLIVLFLKSNEKNGASDFELLTKVFTLIASRFKGLSNSLR